MSTFSTRQWLSLPLPARSRTHQMTTTTPSIKLVSEKQPASHIRSPVSRDTAKKEEMGKLGKSSIWDNQILQLVTSLLWTCILFGVWWQYFSEYRRRYSPWPRTRLPKHIEDDCLKNGKLRENRTPFTDGPSWSPRCSVRSGMLTTDYRRWAGTRERTIVSRKS